MCIDHFDSTDICNAHSVHPRSALATATVSCHVAHFWNVQAQKQFEGMLGLHVIVLVPLVYSCVCLESLDLYSRFSKGLRSIRPTGASHCDANVPGPAWGSTIAREFRFCSKTGTPLATIIGVTNHQRDVDTHDIVRGCSHGSLNLCSFRQILAVDTGRSKAVV